MKLLEQITRCPIVKECLANSDSDYFCSKIVRSQRRSLENFQVPEPWSGHIKKAKILFIGSNPSISGKEFYPRWSSWSDDKIVDYFENRFDSCGKSASTWAEARNRAKELLGKEVIQGEDYALTDVVHCKSKNERGVRDAVEICSRRYLKRVLRVSGASVVVVLGKRAAKVVCAELGISSDLKLYGPAQICGRARCLVFMQRSGSSEKRKFSNSLPPQERGALREFLKSG